VRRAALSTVLGAALAALAAPALADPTIAEATWSPDAGRRVRVELRTTLAAPGRARIEGTVNGRPLRATKRVRAGTRRVRLQVDARKARIRDLGEPLVFDLRATVAERGVEDRAERTFRTTVPVPVVLVPGLGNEDGTSGLQAFAAALDVAAGGAWQVGTPEATATIHFYPSTTAPLPELADGLDAAVKQSLRGTVFGKADIVGYSMGGLVTRQWLADSGGARARRVVFLATPHEGTPIAYIAYQFTNEDSVFAGLLDATVLGGLPVDLDAILQGLLDPEASEALRTFFPTYTWAFVDFLGTPVPVPSLFLPDSESPLTDLNRTAPPAGVAMHTLYYTSLPTDLLGIDIGTIDTVDLTAVLAGETPDLTQLAQGDGDGVVPARSARADDVPAWRDAMTPRDLGVGTHVTLPLDPLAAAAVAGILQE
jgi:pimeloyl-ACP methyl ester carboxylesterase